jgi:hypothetical protein
MYLTKYYFLKEDRTVESILHKMFDKQMKQDCSTGSVYSQGMYKCITVGGQLLTN